MSIQERRGDFATVFGATKVPLSGVEVCLLKKCQICWKFIRQ